MSYEAGTCNTICDVTGFKVKKSDTVQRWDGVRCIPEAWNPRHPQDIAPNIIETKIFSDARVEPEVTGTIQSYTVI